MHGRFFPTFFPTFQKGTERRDGRVRIKGSRKMHKERSLNKQTGAKR